MPTMREVTKEVRVVLDFLKSSEIEVFTLRTILAGLSHSYISEHLLGIGGLLKSWPLDEIAQFTDFLLNEGFMLKQGQMVKDIPSYFLKPVIVSLELDVVITMPIHEVVPIAFAYNKRPTCRNRQHHISKHRFYPKGFNSKGFNPNP